MGPKIAFLVTALVVVFVISATCVNHTRKRSSMSFPRAITNGTLDGVRCYDYRLGQYIDTGLQFYSHQMGQLAKYILDQIVRARIAGYWLVHAEMIGQRRQGLDWQDLTNGDLFAQTTSHGCYYHDSQTYITILRY